MRALPEDARRHIPRHRSKAGWFFLAGAIVLALWIGAYLRYGERPKPAAPRPASPAQADRAPLHPLAPAPDAATRPPLPPLPASDPVARTEAAALANPAQLDLLQADDVVRRWVVTVDALSRERMAQRASPVHRVDGELVVDGGAGEWTLSSGNYARYEPYIALAESIDPQALANAYRRLYPLFQQAYVDLVDPGGYFNDRLVEVIDHLLATPDLPEGARLTRPSVTYRFADPDLEALSAGRKALLRMGPDNARRVKTVLTRLRAELAKAPVAR